MHANHLFDSGNYPIYTGPAAWDALNAFFGSCNYSKIFILVDENTNEYCLSLVVRKAKVLAGATVLKIESGEQNKSIEVCTKLWRLLMNHGADRRSLLVNIGGGVISDLGGFVAATFMRGIQFINIPTTLLAQVDASIGSKVGVDMDGIKNQIGLFSDPLAVFVITEFLHTLPQRHLRSGYAEMIKHALIADPEYWKVITKQGFDNDLGWEYLIEQSMQIKQQVVKFDPFERNLRKVLNFGHTIGHGLESYSLLHDEKPMLHGEAIAIGMICEAFISNKMCGLPEDELKEIVAHVNASFGYRELNGDLALEVLEIIKHDKKSVDGHCRLTLLKNIGKAVIDQECTPDVIVDSMHFYLNSSLVLAI
ncbi:MAG: 3-dehydroquinate synthase [Bacteroidales bacterium]